MPNKYLDSVGLAEYTSLIKAELAPKNSPALTGTPTAPTPTAGDDSTKIATTEFVNNYLPLSGGTMTGQLVVNRNNGVVGGGIKIAGSGQNFAISVSNTNVTKGTAPSGNQYWGIDFYGSDMDNYNKRIGMLETTLDSNNVATTAIRAYNCTTNTNTGNCSITVNVDDSGNAYTSAPTPAAGDNSTKIATTAFVNTKAGKYLPLAGGTMTGNLKFSQDWCNIFSTKNTTRLQIGGGSSDSTGSVINLYGKDYSYNGSSSAAGQFYFTANNGTNNVSLVGKPDGTLTWNGVGLGGTSLGNAPTNTATNFTLPKAGTYLVITGHNSTPGTNSIFIVRTGGNMAFKMGGGGNITMTCSGTTITVTSSGGQAQVYYIFLG